MEGSRVRMLTPTAVKGVRGTVLAMDDKSLLAFAVRDQSQELSDSFSAYQPHQPVDAASATGLAQTFRAGISGPLSLIELELSRNVAAGTTEALTVEIRAGDPMGALLATASVAAASIPAFPTSAWIPVSFATPATVTAGEPYAIVMPPGPFTGATDPSYLWTIAFADVYVNGVAWDHYGDSGVWESYVFGSDRTFRTYVGVEAPTLEIGATFAGMGRISRESGSATLTGEVVCTLPVEIRLEVTLRQRAGRFTVVTAQEVVTVPCNDTDSFELTMHGNGPFQPGRAEATWNASAFHPGSGQSAEASGVEIVKLGPK
jgi:hypothetical protein